MDNKTDPQQVVIVVDDDESMRVALTYLFRSMKLAVKVFSSASQLLDSKLPDVASCLVLDIRLPGVSGLEFQDVLAKAGNHIPIIFMTGHGDIPMTVRAMKAGAIDFLPKPFRDQDMLDAVTRALAQDGTRRAGLQAASALRQRHQALTPRQSELFSFVTSGLMNKQIAARLDV
ncbi:MAG: response regulator transcription factor, partial [Bosea sp. (in: a-proteobacteria)]